MKKISENRDSVAQKRAAARQQKRRRRVYAVIDANEHALRTSGCVSETWRETAGGRYGPYFHVTFRVAGKQTKVYLGRSKRLAAAVRARLTELKRPRRDRRAYERRWKSQRATLRELRTNMARELAPLGLRVQGAEIRGWRRLMLRISAFDKVLPIFVPSPPSSSPLAPVFGGEG